VDRGGDITFHGPGQVVFYPIVDLGVRGGDLHRYMRDLEEAAINFLSIYSVAGARVAERTGVWVSGRKIASIGIAARTWITYHGISININVDLKWFSMINPCGIKDIKATSLAELLGEEIDMECAKREALRQLSAIFNFTEAHEESPAMA
jgi:lipoate-protein ligase B